MNLQFWGMSLKGVAMAIGFSIFVAELAGYVLHRVMHGERFPALSKAHMIHHIELYAPDQSMRSEAYKDATEGRASVGNIGMEWVVPSALILGVCWVSMCSLHVTWKYQLLVMVILLGWPIFMFSYLHDRMHISNFWMVRVPVVRVWFTRARRLHDIHHRALNDDGRMDSNFGIGFFFFDRVFRTMAKQHRPLNRLGLQTAISRHRSNFGPDEIDRAFHRASSADPDQRWRRRGN
ncbi:MAG TPA: sterol desaturase family protein [Desulfomonilaceae bacterium]|nr:sterol desaturase family protein [Desulfomonilaceae bacterium]